MHFSSLRMLLSFVAVCSTLIQASLSRMDIRIVRTDGHADDRTVRRTDEPAKNLRDASRIDRRHVGWTAACKGAEDIDCVE